MKYLFLNNLFMFYTISNFLMIVALSTVAYIVWRIKQQSGLWTRAKSIIHTHAEALGRKRHQLVVTDAYGKQDLRRWHKEIDRFVQAVLVDELGNAAVGRLMRKRHQVIMMIDVASIASVDESAFVGLGRAPSTKEIGDEYEVLCADLLYGTGWTVRRTGGSGDQGCDLIAERNGIRVAVQCKRYSGSVGNAAVQEVAAARDYEEADYGVVVTNSRYTPAAERLAQRTRVLLLHDSDLPKLYQRIAGMARQR